MTKRNMKIVLALLLLSVCTVHTAMAMPVYVNNTGGDHGTTIYVPINVSNAPGQVGAMDISLTYNSNVLTALGVVNGKI
ncbi:MAG: cohesin domain-containing protein, partial [Methanosarcinaceae archaeon]